MRHKLCHHGFKIGTSVIIWRNFCNHAFLIGSKEVQNWILWSMHFRKKNPEFWLAYFYANLQIRVCNRCGWNRIRNMSAFEYSTTGMILESVEYKQFKLRLKSDSNRRKYLNWVNQDQLTWPFRPFYLKPYWGSSSRERDGDWRWARDGHLLKVDSNGGSDYFRIMK